MTEQRQSWYAEFSKVKIKRIVWAIVGLFVIGSLYARNVNIYNQYESGYADVRILDQLTASFNHTVDQGITTATFAVILALIGYAILVVIARHKYRQAVSNS